MGRPRKYPLPSSLIEQQEEEPLTESLYGEDEEQRIIVHESDLHKPTKREMEDLGYRKQHDTVCGKLTPGCRQTVESWMSPQARLILVNPMPRPDSPWTAHATTCPSQRPARKGK